MPAVDPDNAPVEGAIARQILDAALDAMRSAFEMAEIPLVAAVLTVRVDVEGFGSMCASTSHPADDPEACISLADAAAQVTRAALSDGPLL